MNTHGSGCCQVVNTGEFALTGVTIKDSLVTVDEMTLDESMARNGILEVGETWTYFYNYTITQADLDEGQVYNHVSITTKESPEPREDDHTVPADKMPAITVDKSLAEETYQFVDDKLHYTVVVTNTGNMDLSDITISDSLVNLSGTLPAESAGNDGILKPGETWTYRYTYTVSGADLTAGSVRNLVSVQFPEIPEPVTDEVLVNGTTVSAQGINKNVGDCFE